mgnify:CR=1 FL=1
MVGTADWPGFPATKGAAMTEFDESPEDSLDVDDDYDAFSRTRSPMRGSAGSVPSPARWRAGKT